jgi:hypothetical protein
MSCSHTSGSTAGRARSLPAQAVPRGERSAVRPTAPTRGRRQSPQGTPVPWRSAVVRSPQQLVQYQVVTAGVHAQCREFGFLEHVIQIGEFVPSRARPVKLIAELLQRHPLHRLLHDTTVITSPRIYLPSVAEPNQIRLRIGTRRAQNPPPCRSALLSSGHEVAALPTAFPA